MPGSCDIDIVPPTAQPLSTEPTWVTVTVYVTFVV